MSACQEKFATYMHEHLDGEISMEHQKELELHLQHCKTCQAYSKELESVEQLLLTLPTDSMPVAVPAGFTEAVMMQLPKPNIKFGAQKWLRRHPLLVAVAMFVILMSASTLAGFNSSSDFAVTKHPELVVQDHTVTVPKGATVKGDIVVENGDLVIEGKVDGDVTVVNGKYMASTANVTGQVKEINATFERLWYWMKDKAKGMFSFK